MSPLGPHRLLIVASGDRPAARLAALLWGTVGGNRFNIGWTDLGRPGPVDPEVSGLLGTAAGPDQLAGYVPAGRIGDVCFDFVVILGGSEVLGRGSNPAGLTGCRSAVRVGWNLAGRGSGHLRRTDRAAALEADLRRRITRVCALPDPRLDEGALRAVDGGLVGWID